MRDRSTTVLVIGAIIVIGLLIAGCGALAHATEKNVTFKVTDKAIMNDSNNGHKYMIYTDHGVYRDTDSIWFLKFNSSDVYGQLQRGKTYTCKTNGFRIPFFSSYRNIISCSS